MERIIGRGGYACGYADIYDYRGQLINHVSCDALVGYGPQGFVIRKGAGYWAIRAEGGHAGSVMSQFEFEKKKWDFHDSFLRVLC